jgi:tetratricopeptide (TPR) repeat protein
MTLYKTDRFWMVWPCVLAERALHDFDELIEWARAAEARQPGVLDNSLSLGAILFRAGQYREAIALLEKLAEARRAVPQTAYACYFLAMAHHPLDHPTQASRWLEGGNEFAREQLEQEDLSWQHKATLQLLCVEAQQLIRGEQQ